MLITRKSIAYIVTSGTTGIIDAVVLLLATAVLAPESYAIAGTYLCMTAIIATALEYSFLSRRTYVNSPLPADLHHIFSASVILYVMGALFFMLVGWQTQHLWEKFYHLDVGWVLLACVNGLCIALSTIGFALWQIKQKTRDYCIHKIILAAANLVIAVICLYVLRLQWHSLPIALLATNLCGLVIIALKIVSHHQLQWHISFKSLRQCGLVIIALVPYKLCVTLFAFSGPIIVGYFSGLEASGLYLLATQIANLLSLFYEGLLLAAVPVLLTNASPSFSIRGAFLGYIALVGATGLIISFFSSYLIRYFFPPAYEYVIAFVPWLILARCLHSINRFIQELAFFRLEKFRTVSFVCMTAVCFYLLATVTAISVYGGIGGGIGLAVGHLVWLLLIALSCNKTIRSYN